MTVEGARAIRRKEVRQLQPLLFSEARADADVVQRARVVIESEQQRTDGGFLGVFMPSEASHDAIAIALMFNLEHYALVRLIRPGLRFRDHSVEPGALEA